MDRARLAFCADLQFFLKGTALQSLSQDYENLKHQQESIAISTAKQREAIPAMEESLERLRRKREASQMVLKLKEKRARLKHQQAWAFVTEKEIVCIYLALFAAHLLTLRSSTSTGRRSRRPRRSLLS